MSRVDRRVVDAMMGQIAQALADVERRPVVIGLCGSQGSGKSTLAGAVQNAAVAIGIRIAVLSIDDLYLTRAQRAELGRTIHPLLATRGPPGTHDVELGLRVFDELATGRAIRLPRFDKAVDDRAAPSTWPYAPHDCEVLLFEGWCVGAVAQQPDDLVAPINALEREEDPHGIWRCYVNDRLEREYQQMFARIDRLVLLAAPGFEIVRQWRLEQERTLALVSTPGQKMMDEAAIGRFVRLYERLTRHILNEMPARADLLVCLDEQRRPLSISSL